MQTSDQIVQQIMQQTDISEDEVRKRIQQLEASLHYHTDDFNDPTIPQLLAQELNVDLGDPSNYLYSELIFDKDPFFIRIIPFVTVDKESIKATLQKIMVDLAGDGYRFGGRDVFLEGLSFFSDTDQNTVVRDNILFCFTLYRDWDNVVSDNEEEDEIVEYSLHDIVDQAELYRTFNDYKVIRKFGEKAFVPYSVVDKVFCDPPEWMSFDEENNQGDLQFPYINLETLRMTPELEVLSLSNYWPKEIIGTEALKFCRNLKEISLYNEGIVLEKCRFPRHLSLPKLELLEIIGSNLKSLDLSFLQASPNLQRIIVVGNPSLKTIILPPLDRHALLEEIYLHTNNLDSLTFSDTLNCPKLKKLILRKNLLLKLDLRPLSSCTNLQEIDLSGNLIESLDLSPLQHCVNLLKIHLCNNQIKTLDLSSLQYCQHLNELDLSMNQIEKLDLSPLKHCTNLQTLDLRENSIESLDLSPLKDSHQLQRKNILF